MPMIQERLNKVGNVIKFEEHINENITRDTVSVTYAKADSKQMEVGEVLIADSGDFREIVTGDIAGIATADLAVLIDDRIEELEEADKRLPTPANKVSAVVLHDMKGVTTVRFGGLSIGVAALTKANREAVVTRLGQLNFKVAELFSTKY